MHYRLTGSLVFHLCTLLLSLHSPSVLAADIPLYHVGNRDKGWTQGQNIQDPFLDKVQPILTTRCVACHGCYEAPCQLNLQSYEGVKRGYNPIPIFSAKRVDYTAPTRMDDPVTADFMSVLPDAGDPGLISRFVEESSQNNAEGFPIADPAALQKDYQDNDKRACVATSNQFQNRYRTSNPWKVVTFEEFTRNSRYLGMPFGLTHLQVPEQEALKDWIQKGAEGPGEAARAILEKPSNSEPIFLWERFLNQGPANTKALQTARYIYEHVYSTIIQFDESPGEYYDLVRSRSPDGAIDLIQTELPTDNPGSPVYYRFRKVTRAIVQKTANVWHLNATKLKHLDEMFMKSDWGPEPIPTPDYSTNNIFSYFSRIPAAARAHFMQENARVIVGGMVQGMVCVGSTATYAISDHFWAWMLNTDIDPSVQNPGLGLPSLSILNTAPEPWVPRNFAERQFLKAAENLDLANQAVVMRLIGDFRKVIKLFGFGSGEQGGDDMLAEAAMELHKQKVRVAEILGALVHWMRTTHANHFYQAAFEQQLRMLLKKQGRDSLTLNDLWKGDGDPNYPGNDNPNAWLDITRHERNASVQFGPEGGFPQTIWLMSYSNFERLYYDLVAEYKAWGIPTHKMATWRHMSYVRLEGEDLAISLLPISQRAAVRTWFTHGLGGLKNKLFFPLYSTQFMYSTEKMPGFWGKLGYKVRLPARPDGLDSDLHGASPEETVQKIMGRLQKDFAAVAAKGTVHAEMVSGEQRAWEKGLIALENRSEVGQGETFAQFLPNITYLRIEGSDKKVWVYTILADRGYKSHNIMLLENPEREPKFDTLAVYHGFVGAYPEVFLDIPLAALDGIADEIKNIRSGKDWSRVTSKYGVKRNTDNFWTFFDWMHEFKGHPSPGNDPAEQGVVDLSQHMFF